MDDIRHNLTSDTFGILEFYDCDLHHRDGETSIWGLENQVKKDLRGYYYFSFFLAHPERGCLPEEVYVNGVLATMAPNKERAYLIKKDLVREPLLIEVREKRANRVHFVNIPEKDNVYKAGERVSITLFYDKIEEFKKGDRKPIFTSSDPKTGKEIVLQDFSFNDNPILYSISFIMPGSDVDIAVSSAEDESKGKLLVDDSALKPLLASVSSFITQALYSDDYDMGMVDHCFEEREIAFSKGSPLKVVLYLKEEKEVICLLGEKAYRQNKKTREEYEDRNGKRKTCFRYEYRVSFVEDATLSFKVLA